MERLSGASDADLPDGAAASIRRRSVHRVCGITQKTADTGREKQRTIVHCHLMTVERADKNLACSPKMRTTDQGQPATFITNSNSERREPCTKIDVWETFCVGVCTSIPEKARGVNLKLRVTNSSEVFVAKAIFL